MTHCRSNPNFNFHKYMIRALEDDFKQVVGISWYLWLFVVLFLLLNIDGWHTYFWIAFIPFIDLRSGRMIEMGIERESLYHLDQAKKGTRNYAQNHNLLLAVGTKLEHVITQLAHEVAEKHAAIEGDLVVQPSDDHFWFHQPGFVLFLIHFILFQNAFEIAFFFWIWVTYGFDSCIMGQVRYIIPRLVVGVFIQVLCSYSTLPLYAIVTQMGTHYKRAIFNEHLRKNIVGWAQKAKKRKELKADGEGSSQDIANTGIQLGLIFPKKASAPGDSSARKADGTSSV